MKRHEKALRQAVRAAGGPTALARRLGIKPQAVVQWRECPVRRVLEVERASGVSRSELRPDLYPAAREAVP